MEPNYELTDDHAASHLTDKQRLAVDCIVRGLTDQEVAKEIGLESGSGSHGIAPPRN